jgi:hypothetical protein
MPWKASEIAPGFKTANAYYRGNAYVEGVAGLTESGKTLQVCFGTKSGSTCNMQCQSLSSGKVGSYITGGNGPKDLSTDWKKLIGCSVGQCNSNAYNDGFFWYCPAADRATCGSQVFKYSSSYSTGSWNTHSPAYSNGFGAHNQPVHWWGSGFGLNTCNKEVGFGCWGDGGFGVAEPNVYQVRYQR